MKPQRPPRLPLRNTPRFLGTALAALVLTVAGCGGDDDESSFRGEASAPSESTAPPGSAGTTAGAPSAGAEQAPTKAKPIDRDEYRRRADQICRRAQLAIARRSAKFRDVVRAFSEGKIERQEYFRRAGTLARRSGEVAQRAVVDLKDLPPPTSRRDAVEAYLQGATTQSAILTAQGRALRAGRTKEVVELNRRIAQAGQKTRNAARRVGFGICGGGPS